MIDYLKGYVFMVAWPF